MDEFKQAQRDSMFSNEVLRVRDMLEIIVSGEIERGRCVAGQRECYGAKPGKRKLTLVDAKKIAKVAVFVLNQAVNKFDWENDR